MGKLPEELFLLKEEEYDEFCSFIPFSCQSEINDKTLHPAKVSDYKAIFESFIQSPVVWQKLSNWELGRNALPEKGRQYIYDRCAELLEICHQFWSWKQLKSNNGMMKSFRLDQYAKRGNRSGIEKQLEGLTPFDLSQLRSWDDSYVHFNNLSNEHNFLSSFPKPDYKRILANLKCQMEDFALLSRFRKLWILNVLFSLIPETEIGLAIKEFEEEINLCGSEEYNNLDSRISFLSRMVGFWIDVPELAIFEKFARTFTNYDLYKEEEKLYFSPELKGSIYDFLINISHRAWSKGIPGFWEIKIDLIFKSISNFAFKSGRIKFFFFNICSYFYDNTIMVPSPANIQNDKDPFIALLKLHVQLQPNVPHHKILQNIDLSPVSGSPLIGMVKKMIDGYTRLVNHKDYLLIKFCEGLTLLGIQTQLYQAALLFREYATLGKNSITRKQARVLFIMSYFDGIGGPNDRFLRRDPKQPKKNLSKEEEINSPFLGDLSEKIRSLYNGLHENQFSNIPDRTILPLKNASSLLKSVVKIESKPHDKRGDLIKTFRLNLKKDEPVFFRNWFVNKYSDEHSSS